MTPRWIVGVVVLAVAWGVATPAPADPLMDFLSSVARDTKRRQCWPRPFIYPDRQSAREPFAIMANNGWQRQNLLVDVHFEGSAGQLSEAGKLKVLSILNETPEEHRLVYVHRAATAQETFARIQAVQQYVAQSIYAGSPLPPVLESARPDDSWPADRVEMIGRKFQAATPDPKLPTVQAKSSGGGK